VRPTMQNAPPLAPADSKDAANRHLPF
jgi:hypothetical protein